MRISDRIFDETPLSGKPSVFRQLELVLTDRAVLDKGDPKCYVVDNRGAVRQEAPSE